jgi:signal transduction histidine kinase
VAINPKQTSPNHLVPPVVIEQMLVDGVTVPPVHNASSGISPRHRKIEIQFTALSFVAPENVVFRYKLDNWDDGWINAPRGQRSVSYSRLPAGSYVFHVIACNNAGIWNETGATLPFEVEPFVWQMWWFRLSTLAAIVLTVALAVRYQSHRKYRRRLIRLEEEALLQKERARIARDIHDELGANLTQISLLGKFTLNDLADPQKAGPHVAKMAAIARQGVRSVDEIVWAVNPRNDTLAQLLDYAGQYAVDFLHAAGIRCRIDLPENIPARELAADVRHGLFMVVKEALNNAVKHSGANEIIFRVELPGDRLILSIMDNGRGFAAGEDNALADGLRNMTQRATDLGGSCEITSQPGNGTKVRVELRLP